jgi:hypothetical protein
MDPNSPPKAQRTLVDAEVGTLSETQWPIIRPENVSPSETILTTDEKGMQQQQQQQSNMFNSLAAVHNTNVSVENSASRSSSTFDVQAERDISPGYEQTTSVRDDDIHHKTEVSRLCVLYMAVTALTLYLYLVTSLELEQPVCQAVPRCVTKSGCRD